MQHFTLSIGCLLEGRVQLPTHDYVLCKMGTCGYEEAEMTQNYSQILHTCSSQCIIIGGRGREREMIRNYTASMTDC